MATSSVETPVERVLGALRSHGEQPKMNGKGYVSRCPAHEDSTPSLSVTEGRDGSCLVHCHANCDPERIINELGLQWEDLFPARQDNGRREVARYPYVDETGTPLFEVVRGLDENGKKTFRQEPANGRRGPGSMKGTRLVLYRLDRVVKAVAAGEMIYVVEGEKDVESIERVYENAVATCNPMGAGKWRDEYAQSLVGTRVVICADRDDPGRAHARVVARSLGMLGIDFDLMEPATGKDVTDHLAEGLDLDSLEPIKGEEVNAEVDVDRFGLEPWSTFRDHTDEDIDYLVGGLIPQGSLVFLASQPKAGKTWLALALAVSVATGSQYLERFDVPHASPVLYLALEGHRTDYRTRLGAITRGYSVDPDSDALDRLTISYQPVGLDLMDPSWASSLTDSITETGARIVFVDVLRNGAPRLREDGQGSGDFALIRKHLQPLLKAGVTVVLVHHFTKTSDTTRKRSIGEMMSGSGSLFGSADLIIGITSPPKDWENLKVEFIGRSAPAPDPFRVQIVGERTGKYGGFRYADALALSTLHQDDEQQQAPKWHHAIPMAQWIRELGRRVSISELEAQFRVHKNTIRDHKHDLYQVGIDYVTDGGNSGFEEVK